MSKTLAIVHPDKTVHIEMPDEIFDNFCNLLSLKLIKVRFTDTQSGLRGRKMNGVIFDEIVDDKTIDKLRSVIYNKSNQGSNLPGKEQ